MDEYADRERKQMWQMAVCAALAGQKTYAGSIQAADNVLSAFEGRFLTEEKKDE